MTIEQPRRPSRRANRKYFRSSGLTNPTLRPTVQQSNGFTLLEVLIALGIVGVLLAGIYAAYQRQMQTFHTQEQIVDMQQNVRVALYFLERELRQAGLDPTGNAGAGITVANAETITFSMDFTGGQSDAADNDGDLAVDDGIDTVDNDGDGLVDEPDEAEWFDGDINDVNEQITYFLSNDANANGINDGVRPDNNDGSTANLLRISQAGGPPQVVAANIDALNFVYLGINPADNSCTEDCLLNLPIANLEDIRSVQVTLVARAGATVRTMATEYTDRTTYYNQPPANQIILPSQGDAFRRIRLTTNVRCRNLGL